MGSMQSRNSLPSIQWHQHDSQYTSCKWTGGCSCCWRQTMVCLSPFLLHSYKCGKMRLERPLRDLTANSLGTIDFPMILSDGPPSACCAEGLAVAAKSPSFTAQTTWIEAGWGLGSVKPQPKLQTAVQCWGMCHRLGIPTVNTHSFGITTRPYKIHNRCHHSHKGNSKKVQSWIAFFRAKTPNRNIADCSKAGTMPDKEGIKETAQVPPFES